MSTNTLDIRAYSLLLNDQRKTLISLLYEEEFDLEAAPTHRLDDFLAKRIAQLTSIRAGIAYTAAKLKHYKEQSNFEALP